MLFPKKIKKGDTIAFVCPSSKVSKEAVLQCKKKIEALGFQTKIADNVTSSYGGYMAGTSEERAFWINKMFSDPEVDGIFCLRGGDGSSRIMEFLNLDLIKKNPKVFLGYSDVTNLHLALNQHCEFVTFHGPMVFSNMLKNFEGVVEDSLFSTINAEKGYTFHNPPNHPLKVLKEGTAKGPLIGGNLSLLSASIGTAYEVDTKGKILFIEEVCEPISKIDKWIYHLRNSNKFHDAEGIILGQFTDIVNENDPDYTYLCSIKDALDGEEIPVLYNVQSGHGELNMTLPLGATCTIDSFKKSIFFEVER